MLYRAASKGAVAKPDKNAPTNITAIGTGATSTPNTAARRRSAQIITVLRGRWSTHDAITWPRPTHGTNDTVTTAALRAAERVRSYTTRVRANRVAQSPNSLDTWANHSMR